MMDITEKEFPSSTKIVVTNAGMDILKNIHIAGKRFKRLNKQLSVEFLVEAYKAGCFKNERLIDVAELCVIRSGIYYGINEAFQQLSNYSLPTAHIGAARLLQSDGSFEAEIYLRKTEMLKNKRHILTSEIIASGSTFEAVFEEIPKNIEKWTIFSVAAANKGCTLLRKLEDEYGIKVNLFVNCFIGGLQQNNTDIPFYNKGSIMPKKVESELRRHYGNEFYEAIRCCIGDGGKRFCNPEKHYEEILETYSGLRFKEQRSQKMLVKILRETEYFLKEIKKDISFKI